jgi:hypothetical protein
VRSQAPSGNLYLADATRVLEFHSSSLKGSPKGDRAYGQKSFTADSCGLPTVNAPFSPMLVATDFAGALYVPDWINNRVTAYDAPLSQSIATRELAQVDFTHNASNFPTARSLQYPSAVTTDQAGHLTLPTIPGCSDCKTPLVLRMDSRRTWLSASRISTTRIVITSFVSFQG